MQPQAAQLSGHVALVTGAGSGIGKATAKIFAAAGAKVGVLSHTAHEIDATVREIKDAGGDAITLIADVANEQQMQQAVNTLVATFGKLDTVFANAGINGVWTPVEELALDEWQRTLATNLTGTFLTIKTAVPVMKQHGGGSITVVASVNGTRTFSNSGATAYSVTKAGQVAMMKMLALELAQSHIRVNAICPGAIETNIDDNTERRDVEKVKLPVEFPKGRHPLNGKPGEPDDIAQMALFLASDLAHHISGTEIWIDAAESLFH